jgi:hypothetical protein
VLLLDRVNKLRSSSFAADDLGAISILGKWSWIHERVTVVHVTAKLCAGQNQPRRASYVTEFVVPIGNDPLRPSQRRLGPMSNEPDGQIDETGGSDIDEVQGAGESVQTEDHDRAPWSDQ